MPEVASLRETGHMQRSSAAVIRRPPSQLVGNLLEAGRIRDVADRCFVNTPKPVAACLSNWYTRTSNGKREMGNSRVSQEPGATMLVDPRPAGEGLPAGVWLAAHQGDAQVVAAWLDEGGGVDARCASGPRSRSDGSRPACRTPLPAAGTAARRVVWSKST